LRSTFILMGLRKKERDWSFFHLHYSYFKCVIPSEVRYPQGKFTGRWVINRHAINSFYFFNILVLLLDGKQVGKIIGERQMTKLPPIKILGFDLVKLVEQKDEYLSRSDYFEIYCLGSFSLNKCSLSFNLSNPLQLQTASAPPLLTTSALNLWILVILVGNCWVTARI